MLSGVAASAKRRSDAGPVVVSWVRSDRMQAIRTRNGSPSRSAMTASAVGFHVGACGGARGSRGRSPRRVHDRLAKASRVRALARCGLYRPVLGRSILTPSGLSAILLVVISVALAAPRR